MSVRAQVDGHTTSAAAVNPNAAIPVTNMGAAGASPELMAIDLQYRQDADSLQTQMVQAQNELSQCATQESMGNISAKTADGAAQTQAIGQIVNSLAGPSSNIGDVVSGGTAASRSEVAKAQAKQASIRKQAQSSGGVFEYKNDAIVYHQEVARTECMRDGSARTDRDGNTILDKSTGQPVTDISACMAEYKREAATYSGQLEEANQTIAAGTDKAQVLEGAGMNLAAGGISAGLGLWANHQSSAGIREGNKLGRQICEQNANAQIDALKRQMVLLDNRHSNDITNATLAAAMQQRLATAVPDTAGVGGIDLTSNKLAAKNPFDLGNKDAGTGSGNNAQPTAAAGGEGGSGATGDAPYGFGNGRNDAAIGGGLPMQPDAASYASDGGGAGGGFGFGDNFGFDQAPAADGAAGAGGAAQAAGVNQVGDGGLMTLMARARMRYAAHASDLVKSIDLKEMARAPASKNVNPKPDQRL
jgi:hypothetical protein